MTCNCTGTCRRPPYTCNGGYIGQETGFVGPFSLMDSTEPNDWYIKTRLSNLEIEEYHKRQENLVLATDKVVQAALRFNDCASEFEGELKYCDEYLDSLYHACDQFKKAKELAQTK